MARRLGSTWSASLVLRSLSISTTRDSGNASIGKEGDLLFDIVFKYAEFILPNIGNKSSVAVFDSDRQNDERGVQSNSVGASVCREASGFGLGGA